MRREHEQPCRDNKHQFRSRRTSRRSSSLLRADFSRAPYLGSTKAGAAARAGVAAVPRHSRGHRGAAGARRRRRGARLPAVLYAAAGQWPEKDADGVTVLTVTRCRASRRS